MGTKSCAALAGYAGLVRDEGAPNPHPLPPPPAPQPGSTEPVSYQGELKAAPLAEFLEPFAAPPASPGSRPKRGTAAKQEEGLDSKGAGGNRGKSPEALMKELLTPRIQELAPGNLSALDAGEGMWLVGFYHEGKGASRI